MICPLHYWILLSPTNDLFQTRSQIIREPSQQLATSMIDSIFVVFVLDLLRTVQALWCFSSHHDKQYCFEVHPILPTMVAMTLTLRKQNNEFMIGCADLIGVQDLCVSCFDRQWTKSVTRIVFSSHRESVQ